MTKAWPGPTSSPARIEAESSYLPVNPIQPIGVIANPASGKDIRRLSAGASLSDNREKVAILRRALAGATGAGATAFVFMDDPRGLAASAFERTGLDAEPLPCTGPESAAQSSWAARQMCERQCAAILVLGGDGTNRAVVSGWRDPVLLPLSTGTNNVFPIVAEGTVAGAALGLISLGAVQATQVCRQTKVIDIEVEGEASDLALIDAVLTRDTFVGAKALLDTAALKFAVLSRADPASTGMSSVGGLLQPLCDAQDGALALTFGSSGRSYQAALAPGRFETVSVASLAQLELGQRISAEGPGLLAFDGERDRILQAGQRVTFSVSRTGPHLIDTRKVMQLAAELRLLESRSG